MTYKIIIDCDPGIDDAMALIYAVASEEIEILDDEEPTLNNNSNETNIIE